MRTVFVDTAYWAAVIRPRDQWHQAALRAEKKLGNVLLVTTYEVLTEVLTSLAGSPDLRKKAVRLVHEVRHDPHVEIIPQSRKLFDKGFDLYARRLDKKYSMQDCISMVIMREMGIREVLTSDHDFTQEGFIILMK